MNRDADMPTMIPLSTAVGGVMRKLEAARSGTTAQVVALPPPKRPVPPQPAYSHTDKLREVAQRMALSTISDDARKERERQRLRQAARDAVSEIGAAEVASLLDDVQADVVRGAL